MIACDPSFSSFQPQRGVCEQHFWLEESVKAYYQGFEVTFALGPCQNATTSDIQVGLLAYEITHLSC